MKCSILIKYVVYSSLCVSFVGDGVKRCFDILCDSTLDLKAMWEKVNSMKAYAANYGTCSTTHNECYTSYRNIQLI